MKRVIRAKLEQNPHILKLLLDTGNTEIIHRPVRKDGTPYPDSTTVPEKIFSGFLMELREEFRSLASVVCEGMKDRVEEIHRKE
jgi:hypothetical protein